MVSWIGTDVNGDSLISASDRIKNFENYNIKGLYESLVEVDNNV